MPADHLSWIMAFTHCYCCCNAALCIAVMVVRICATSTNMTDNLNVFRKKFKLSSFWTQNQIDFSFDSKTVDLMSVRFISKIFTFNHHTQLLTGFKHNAIKSHEIEVVPFIVYLMMTHLNQKEVPSNVVPAITRRSIFSENWWVNMIPLESLQCIAL